MARRIKAICAKKGGFKINHTNPNREFSHDCFELGVILCKCIFGDIFDTVLEILEFTLGDE